MRLNNAYQAGKNSAKYGATLKNSHFKWFATPETRDEWERGRNEYLLTAPKEHQDDE